MMRNIMLGFFALSILGIVFFTGQGSANTLNSSTELNKIGALKILDSTDKTMMGMNLGTTDTITSITLTFKTSIDGSTVNISLTDSDDLEIGVDESLLDLARDNIGKDFIGSKHGPFHPGVMLAVYEVFGKVNVSNGFWWIFIINGELRLESPFDSSK